MNLTKIESQFWDYQATVTEDGIIAKIMRVLEKPPSIAFEHLSAEDHAALNHYEVIGFFMPVSYPIISIAIPLGPGPTEIPGRPREDMRVIATKPEVHLAYVKVGQAQLWYSTITRKCVLWECLVWKPIKDKTKEVWEWLLKYIEFLEMKEIYTHATDRDYDDVEYCALLSSFGFHEAENERIMCLRHG